MELMPHIKALLDDLIDMTKHIVVKRTDIANRYENNSKTLLLYQQCAEIIDGNPSFYSYNVYPKEVLRSYGSWKEIDKSEIDIELVPCNGSDDEILNKSGKIITLSKRSPNTIAEIGDIWVNILDNGTFAPIKEIEYAESSYEYKLSGVDTGTFNENDIIENIIQSNGQTHSLNLFIHNTQVNKYIPVKLILVHEYCAAEYDESGNEITKFDPSYAYDIDSNGNYIRYQKDNTTNKYYLMKENESGTNYLYHRSKIEIYYDDEKYWDSEDVYFPKNDNNVDPTKYVNIDPMEYIPNIVSKDEHGNSIVISYNQLYDLYTGPVKDSKGYHNYNIVYEIDESTGDYKIDPSTGEYIISSYGEMMDLYIRDNESKYRLFDELTDVDENGSYPSLYTKKKYDGVVYKKYFNINRSNVYNSTYEKIGEDGNLFTLDKYERSSNNGSNGESPLDFELYYSYTDNDAPNKCYIKIIPIITGKTVRTIESGGEYGETEVSTDLTKYYVWEDIDGFGGGEYISFYDDLNSRTVYKYSPDTIGKKYCVSTKVPQTGNISFDTCIYIASNLDKYYRYTRNYSNSQINNYYLNRELIPEKDRDAIKDLMNTYTMKLYCPDYYNNEDFAVPQYTGETNRYYRELNGLPALDIHQVHPTIARFTINPSYDGENTRPYLWELTDAEVEVLIDKGYLDEFQKNYPDLAYLKHLGKNRIDVIKARQASPFDLLYIDSSNIPVTSKMFADNYKIAKTYILARHYDPNMFGMHRFYHAYVGFSILALAMNLCIEKSGDILITNQFMDQKTVDTILESYGFKGVFDSIPLIYRREIAKNILRLIKNKGIDSIYKLIYDIFNMSDIDIYKYFFRKLHKRDDNKTLLYYVYDENGKKQENTIYDKDKNPTRLKAEFTLAEYQLFKSSNEGDYTLEPVYDLSISQVLYDSDNPTKEIVDSTNDLSYDDITGDDKYWGVYESNELVKEQVMRVPFNYMSSKYITLNNRYNLTELNFNSTYLLNYLLDSTILNNNTNIKLNVDGLDSGQKISDLIIALFAIQAIRLGYDGNIPNDIMSAANIMKFNFSEQIAMYDGIASDIINKYYGDLTIDARNKAQEILTIMESIRQSNNVSNSVKSVVYNDKTDASVNELTKTYISNLLEDNNLTRENDASLYYKLLDYRESAKDLAEFRCFDELIHCISVCEDTNKSYKLSYPVWELMYEEAYDESSTKLADTEKLYYTDIRKSWSLITDDSMKIKIINDCDKDNENKIYHILSDDTEIENDNIYGSTEKDNESNCIYRYDPNTYAVYEYDPISKKEILLEAKYVGVRYRHFVNYDKNKYEVTSNSPLCYSYSDKLIVNLGTITRQELSLCKNIVDDPILMNRISIYETRDVLNDLGYYKIIKSVIDSDLNEEKIVPQINSTPIGRGNLAYIGNISLNDFLSSNAGITGSPMYIEIIRDFSSIDRRYSLKIYKRCETALTYMMWLREMSEELYEYMKPLGGEIDNSGKYSSDYVDRMSVLSSTIIATIESAIESKELKERINLSYVDFENITKYIKLLINVFKSYTIDLSSMDAIFNINDIENERFKIIDDYNSKESSFTTSSLHITSTASSEDATSNRDMLKIKDELNIELSKKISNKGGN